MKAKRVKHLRNDVFAIALKIVAQMLNPYEISVISVNADVQRSPTFWALLKRSCESTKKVGDLGLYFSFCLSTFYLVRASLIRFLHGLVC